jgi:hypothetical protein
MLEKRLNFRHINKPPLIQGKSGAPEMFCADLSTENGDSFALATHRPSLQPWAGIDDYKPGLLP